MVHYTDRSFVYALLGICGAVLVNLILRLYTARMAFYQKVKQGLPMPKWNPIFGHLLVLNDAFETKKLPKNVQRPAIFNAMSDDFRETDLFYLDLWPFIKPLLLVTSPDYAVQVAQQHDLGKPEDLVPFLWPIAGGNSIFSVNGEESKYCRQLLSSGFNSNYILNQTGYIVQEAEEYVKILRKYAESGELVQLEELTLNYTMDISGAMILNTRLHCQQGRNELADAMQHTLNWHYRAELKNPLIAMTPLVNLIRWHNGRKMDKFISKILQTRYKELRDETASKGKRSGIDLLLADYLTEKTKNGQRAPEKVDSSYEKWAIAQLRLLFFVGHDSTSATLCYSYYLLSKNPNALQTLRDEHEKVFGKDRSQLPTLLREQPQLLNQLPYTTAVLKETMRLFPPAGAFRAGDPGVFLRDDKGNSYPTEGTYVWALHPALQRHPKYWKDPEDFIPERFMVAPDHPLYPMKGAWRPFEFGKRDCVGRALAMLDMKITLVMTIRNFDFKDAYEEWDRLYPNPKLKYQTVAGERAYQIGNGGAHPADAFPCRVYIRE